MPSQLQKITQQSSLLDSVYRIVDAISILLGIWLASKWTQLPLSTTHYMLAASALSLFYIAAEVTGMYRNWTGVSTRRELFCSLLTWGSSCFLVLTFAWFANCFEFPERYFYGYWIVVTPCLLITSRVIGRSIQSLLRSYGFNNTGFAIIGINDLGIQLAENIKQQPELGLNFVGFFDDRPGSRLPDLEEGEGKHEGDLTELLARAKTGEVQRIYITFPMRAEARIRSVLERLSDTTASVYIVPDFFVFELLHSRWTDIGGLPAVSVFENPLFGVDGLLKRASDIVFAAGCPLGVWYSDGDCGLAGEAKFARSYYF